MPSKFDYVAPTSVREAVQALAQAGEEAKILAGGQSLVPVMRLRLAYPEVVIDLSKVEEMRGVREEGDALVIGAMTRHSDVITDSLIQRYAGVLSEATATVADPAVRHRGTLGGALAHADPAGDLPAVALALDAVLVLEGPGGRREVPAREFFVDYLTTALSPDEILTAVRIPKLEGDWGWCYEKFNRVAQAWAIVAVAAAVRRDNAAIAEARIGLTNMSSVPVRASAVESALVGVSDRAGIRAAARSAAEGTRAPSDLNAKTDYREHLARVLTERAVAAAAGISN